MRYRAQAFILTFSFSSSVWDYVSTCFFCAGHVAASQGVSADRRALIAWT